MFAREIGAVTTTIFVIDFVLVMSTITVNDGIIFDTFILNIDVDDAGK